MRELREGFNGPRTLPPGCVFGRKIADTVTRALKKEPSLRFPSAVKLAEHLRQVQQKIAVKPVPSPAWGLLGGLALVAWSCWLLHVALYRLTWGNSAIVTDIAIPNLVKAYGAPVDSPDDQWRLFRPSWILVYAIPAVVLCANLVIVWRARRPATEIPS